MGDELEVRLSGQLLIGCGYGSRIRECASRNAHLAHFEVPDRL